MSDPIIFDLDEAKRMEAARAAIAARERKAGRREMLMRVGLIASAPVAASGWLAWAIRPRVEERIEFIPMREDGTIAKAYAFESLPAEAKGDSAINTLWNYVLLRESYSSGMVDTAYRIVSLLSDTRVRNEYQALHNPRNPDRPATKYGDHTTVSITWDSHDDLTLPAGYDGPPPGYAFRYLRTERRKDGTSSSALYRASARIHRNVPGFPAAQRFEFNAAQIQVWEYPEPVALPVTIRRNR